MKNWTIIWVLLLTAGLCFADLVENVTFEQRTDGSLIVDIEYDLSITDTETEKVKITVEASDDGGTTWDLVCVSLTGDVGDNITESGHKTIVWDFYADNPGVESDECIVSVTGQEFGTMSDYDGNTYQTVKIGSQWWMAENLKVTHYNDGFPVGFAENSTDWLNVTGGCYAFYDNATGNIATYGLLYNWAVVGPFNSHNIAPSGWHVPTDDEWTTLTDYLGSAAGSKLAGNAALWRNGVLENNTAFGESGFSALPAGFRDSDNGGFYYLGNNAKFWSATGYGSSAAWYRYLSYNTSGVSRIRTSTQSGFSIRLVRD